MPKATRTKYGTWRVPYRDPTGKQRSKTFKKKVDADAFIHENEVAKRKGDWIDPNLGRTLFGDWYARWDANRIDRRASSVARDDSVSRNHILPEYENRPLADIQPEEIDRWIIRLSRTHAPATVHRAKQLLAAALEAAVDRNMIPKNPARNVTLPQVERTEMRFLTPEEIDHLVAATADQWKAMVLTAAYTGLRRGEIIALGPDSLELRRARLRVTRSVTWVRGHMVEGPPKTNAGRRTVALPPFLVEALRDHLTRYGWAGGRLFTSAEGETIRPTNWRRRVWIPATKAAGLDPLRFHDLRHTHAALLIHAGEHPKVIQSRLGHTTIQTTLDLYGHLFDGMDEAAADRLDAMFRGAGVTEV